MQQYSMLDSVDTINNKFWYKPLTYCHLNASIYTGELPGIDSKLTLCCLATKRDMISPPHIVDGS
jgi:hypothetical protein